MNDNDERTNAATIAFIFLPRTLLVLNAELAMELNTIEESRQKTEMDEFCSAAGIGIDEFVTLPVPLPGKIDDIAGKLQRNDCLVISTVAYLGESLREVFHTVDKLLEARVRLIACKENIDLRADNDVAVQVSAILRNLAGVSKSILSRRNRLSVAIRRAQGRTVGRPRGVPGKSILDGKREEIMIYLEKRVPKAAIARLLNVSRATLFNYVKAHKLEREPDSTGPSEMKTAAGE